MRATILEIILEDKGIEKELWMDLCKKWLNDHNVELIGNVGITVSFDIAWQKGGSGNRYDSLSGHCIMVGYCTKKL